MAKTLQGRVVANKADKTVTVAVSRVKLHPLYRKAYKITTKFSAHDEANEYKVGDLVEIAESRPLSATKHWRVARKISSEDLATKAKS